MIVSNFQILPTSTPPPMRLYPVSEWAQIFDSDPPSLPLYPNPLQDSESLVSQTSVNVMIVLSLNDM